MKLSAFKLDLLHCHRYFKMELQTFFSPKINKLEKPVDVDEKIENKKEDHKSGDEREEPPVVDTTLPESHFEVTTTSQPNKVTTMKPTEIIETKNEVYKFGDGLEKPIDVDTTLPESHFEVTTTLKPNKVTTMEPTTHSVRKSKKNIN